MPLALLKHVKLSYALIQVCVYRISGGVQDNIVANQSCSYIYNLREKKGYLSFLFLQSFLFSS